MPFARRQPLSAFRGRHFSDLPRCQLIGRCRADAEYFSLADAMLAASDAITTEAVIFIDEAFQLVHCRCRPPMPCRWRQFAIV